jgi:hypothetical protein
LKTRTRKTGWKVRYFQCFQLNQYTPEKKREPRSLRHHTLLPSRCSYAGRPSQPSPLSEFDGWPVRSPVNAYPHALRRADHDSGPQRIASPYCAGLLHPLSCDDFTDAHEPVQHPLHKLFSFSTSTAVLKALKITLRQFIYLI